MWVNVSATILTLYNPHLRRVVLSWQISRRSTIIADRGQCNGIDSKLTRLTQSGKGKGGAVLPFGTCKLISATAAKGSFKLPSSPFFSSETQNTLQRAARKERATQVRREKTFGGLEARCSKGVHAYDDGTDSTRDTGQQNICPVYLWAMWAPEKEANVAMKTRFSGHDPIAPCNPTHQKNDCR